MRAGAALALGLVFLAAPGSEHGPVVTVQPPATVLLAPGGSAEARIAVVVAGGFHLQANPASEAYLVPTTLELAGTAGVEPGSPAYPPGRPYRLRGASSDLLTYEGRFDIRLPLKASPGAEAGERALRGKLAYQACDAKSCLFPASVPVELQVTVAPPKAKPGS